MEMSQFLFKSDVSLGSVLIVEEGIRSIPVSGEVFVLKLGQNSVPQVITVRRRGSAKKKCLLAFGLRIAKP